MLCRTKSPLAADFIYFFFFVFTAENPQTTERRQPQTAAETGTTDVMDVTQHIAFPRDTQNVSVSQPLGNHARRC